MCGQTELLCRRTGLFDPPLAAKNREIEITDDFASDFRKIIQSNNYRHDRIYFSILTCRNTIPRAKDQIPFILTCAFTLASNECRMQSEN
jgi:hypothetical protein